MPFLALKTETYVALRRLRLKGETDDDLIMRIVEHAKCYMIIQGAENMERER